MGFDVWEQVNKVVEDIKREIELKYFNSELKFLKASLKESAEAASSTETADAEISFREDYLKSNPLIVKNNNTKSKFRQDFLPGDHTVSPLSTSADNRRSDQLPGMYLPSPGTGRLLNPGYF